MASPAIALASVFFVRRSSQTARKALNLAYKTSQAAYESVKAANTPPVDLFLTQIEYRHATARPLGHMLGAEARACSNREDADSLEVVIRGRLVNNLSSEILLSCWDHPNSGRSTHFMHRNQSVFIIAGTEVRLAHAILLPKQEATFEWIDRKPRTDWINIYNLFTPSYHDDPELRIPRLTWIEILWALAHRKRLRWARFDKVRRAGFRIICETRSVHRVVAVWQAEVTRPPVEVAGRDEDDRIMFQDRIDTIRGPLDDRVVHYRLDYDSTLAQIDPPKHLWLPGRSSTIGYPIRGWRPWRRPRHHRYRGS
ncbi:hypothetical protein ACWGK6_18985 [Streptomyces violaceusniger]